MMLQEDFTFIRDTEVGKIFASGLQHKIIVKPINLASEGYIKPSIQLLNI